MVIRRDNERVCLIYKAVQNFPTYSHSLLTPSGVLVVVGGEGWEGREERGNDEGPIIEGPQKAPVQEWMLRLAAVQEVCMVQRWSTLLELEGVLEVHALLALHLACPCLSLG